MYQGEMDRRLAKLVARRTSKGGQRGVTLVEVLIVVAIMAVIAGGATLLVFPKYKSAKIQSAVVGASAVKQAAELYINLDSDGGECPSLKDLVDVKNIDSSKTDDPFGKPYRIVCADGDVRVYSDGNDRQEGTADDIRDDMKPTDVKKISDL